jgi:hypothetical protein
VKDIKDGKDSKDIRPHWERRRLAGNTSSGIPPWQTFQTTAKITQGS